MDAKQIALRHARPPQHIHTFLGTQRLSPLLLFSNGNFWLQHISVYPCLPYRLCSQPTELPTITCRSALPESGPNPPHWLSAWEHRHPVKGHPPGNSTQLCPPSWEAERCSTRLGRTRQSLHTTVCPVLVSAPIRLGPLSAAHRLQWAAQNGSLLSGSWGPGSGSFSMEETW